MATVLTPKDFATATASWWCPGCGDYGVLAALKQALAELRLIPKDVAFVSGIGCSGKISGYLHSYAFHGVHGRALPVATAVKLANRDLTVIAAGGDGDGYAIGAGHFVHALRRNPDITYIVMDNQTYGLTKGQSSPTSSTGYVTGTSPGGHPEAPINGLSLALAAGGTFLARGFSAQPKALVELLKSAIQHSRLLGRRSDVAVRHLQQDQHVRVVQGKRRPTLRPCRDSTPRIAFARSRC